MSETDDTRRINGGRRPGNAHKTDFEAAYRRLLDERRRRRILDGLDDPQEEADVPLHQRGFGVMDDEPPA